MNIELEQLKKELTRQSKRIDKLESALYLDPKSYQDIEQEEISILNDVYNDEIVTVRPKHNNPITEHS